MARQWFLAGLVVLLLSVFISASTAASKAEQAEPWWKSAVIYEIYPRSFADGRNCGKGNLPGITARLDYLSDLGVDAIWITPCYPSPQVDFGYDISDYCAIDPEFGTLSDFDNLVAEARKRHIRLIVDLVMNHTSDRHPWFIESASSKNNPRRSWYIWSDGKDGGPPNNWLSLFGHSAWRRDPLTGQYYYHFFYPEQPDLNWRNPEVRRAMYDVARFWLDRGVAGFRLDAICTMFEDPRLLDNPLKPGTNKFGDPNMENRYNERQDEVHEVLKELRRVLDSYGDNRLLIGETSEASVAKLFEMYGRNSDEIQLPMNFFFAFVPELSAREFRKQIAASDLNPARGWPVYLLSNHDQVRHYDRYATGSDRDSVAKLMAAMLLTLRGTPILYYGEELGMETSPPTRKQDVRDPIGKLGWPLEKGRDGERTPMQWSDAPYAGFSAVKPWLPVAANYKSHNVAVEQQDPSSILNFYKKLIKLRRNNPAFGRGAYVPLNESDNHVLSYLRQDAGTGDSVLVALNMSRQTQHISFDLKRHGISEPEATTLLSSDRHAPASVLLNSLTLRPFAVYIAQVR